VTSEPLYPLRFAPIFKSALWGGRRLADMFPGAPAEGPVAEAWVLSDQGDNVSRVTEGPLAGMSLRALMRDRPAELLGPSLAHHDTFPLLLKFIDAREPLSVQVHPDDELAWTLAAVPRGKTEAWVVLHAEPGTRIYAGLKAGVDRRALERAVTDGTTADCLHSFEPAVGDCVFLPAGTVHALGGGITVFEVQQTSDTTYRLFDWNRVDAKTGQPRDLHIEKALASTNFGHGPITPIRKDLTGENDLKLVQCAYFDIWRTREPPGECIHSSERGRILVFLAGETTLRLGAVETRIRPFDVALVPPGETVHKTTIGVTFLDIWPL
jgi:mannose-6-phosphate isomerase